MSQQTEETTLLEAQKKQIREHWLSNFEPGDVVTLPNSNDPDALHIIVGLIWMKSTSGWMYFLAEADTLNAIINAKFESELQKIEEIPQGSSEDYEQLALALDVDSL